MRPPFLFLVLFSLALPNTGITQTLTQYFDGDDTAAYNSIIIERDTPGLWQVGPPQKNIFDSAASEPNVIVTDTTDPYPSDTSASFSFGIGPDLLYSWSILAVQWTQRLNMEDSSDGGIVEFSRDTGDTWQNAFNNDSVANFYGFHYENKDTLYTGDYAFSGTDSNWRDIWLCFYNDTIRTDSLLIRYSLHSDSSSNTMEGWTMDNFTAHQTSIHSIEAPEKEENTIKVDPNPSSGTIRLRSKKDGTSRMEEAQVMSLKGEVVERYHRLYGPEPELHLGHLNPGVYVLKIKTGTGYESVRLVLQ